MYPKMFFFTLAIIVEYTGGAHLKIKMMINLHSSVHEWLLLGSILVKGAGEKLHD